MPGRSSGVVWGVQRHRNCTVSHVRRDKRHGDIHLRRRGKCQRQRVGAESLRGLLRSSCRSQWVGLLGWSNGPGRRLAVVDHRRVRHLGRVHSTLWWPDLQPTHRHPLSANIGAGTGRGGKDWYMGQLAAGRTTLQTITLDLLGGATGTDALTVANRWTWPTITPGRSRQAAPYGGELTGVSSLAAVTFDSATTWAAKLAIEGRCGP